MLKIEWQEKLVFSNKKEILFKRVTTLFHLDEDISKILSMVVKEVNEEMKTCFILKVSTHEFDRTENVKQLAYKPLV